MHPWEHLNKVRKNLGMAAITPDWIRNTIEEDLNDYEKAFKSMESQLIEEAAKALFFRDMVDGVVPEEFYDIWEVVTEPDAITGQKIQERYKRKAREYLEERENEHDPK